MEFMINILVSLSSIIITYLITQYFYKKQVNDLNRGVRLYEVRQGKVNDSFYQKFGQYIKNAKQQVLITGKGLEMDSPSELELANTYLNDFKEALKKAEIVRIQYGKKASKRWYSACKELWMDNREKFHFYVMDEQEDLLHSAAIDPYLDSCISEIMIPSPVITSEGRKKDIAGTAIIFKEKPEIALSIGERIILMKDEGIKRGTCKKIDSEEKWDKLIDVENYCNK